MFQFQCPNGHLLQGDPSQAGMATVCPTCQIQFLIPAPVPDPAAPTAPASPGPAAPVPGPGHFPTSPGPAAPRGPSSSGLPHVGPRKRRVSLPPSGQGPATPAATGPAVAGLPGGPAQPSRPQLLSIPCPNGHILESPREMLNQEVLCPHCQAQFMLREKDSLEHKRKVQMAREGRERKLSNTWFNIAIGFAVLVVLALAVMFGLMVYG